MKLRTAILAALLAAAPAAQAAPPPRAVWVWEKESYAMLEDKRAASDAIAFLKARGISTLFLYADAYQGRNLITKKPRLYRRLLRRLRGEGMQAYALLGSAYLNTERYVLPERHADALAMLQRVLDYNKKAGARERFAGVNLDIEPHILDQWKDGRERLLLDFLDMGRELMDLKAASGQDLAVGPAIPFWLDGISLEWNGRLKPVSEHAMDTYDYVALMDYRDRAAGRDGLISHAGSELKYSGGLGRKVWIGVETTPNEIKKVSFNHLAESDMERELGLAAEAFSAEPAFAGFVIHHYRGYRNWLEGQAPKPGPATEK